MLSMFEEVPLNPPFRDKGRVLRRSFFFAMLCGIWLRRITRIFYGVGRLGKELWELIGLIPLYGSLFVGLRVNISLALFFWTIPLFVIGPGVCFLNLIFCMSLYILLSFSMKAWFLIKKYFSIKVG